MIRAISFISLTIAFEFLFKLTAHAQWTQISPPPSGGGITSLRVIDTTLFAGTYYGRIYFSTDRGGHWASVSEDFLQPFSSIVGIGSNIFTCNGEGISLGVLRSSDRGRSWTVLTNGMTDRRIYDLATIGSNLLAAAGGTVYRSTDQGESWQSAGGLVGPQFFFAIAANHSSAFTTNNGQGIYKNGSGIFRSTDGGANWMAVNSGLPSLNPTCVSANDSYVYAGTMNNGVFISTDNGNTWLRANGGIESKFVYALTSNGATAIASTYNAVICSTDRGASWSSLNAGLPATGFSVTLITIGMNTIFLATNPGGVWSRPLSDVTVGIRPTQGQYITEYRLEQNYPNPFNPSAVISYSLPKRANVSLRIFNPLGQQVALLVNEYKEAGDHQATWNASNVPSGIYFYRLQAGEYVETKKMVRLK